MHPDNAQAVEQISRFLYQNKAEAEALQHKYQQLNWLMLGPEAAETCEKFQRRKVILRDAEIVLKARLALVSAHAFAIIALPRRGAKKGRDYHVLPLCEHVPLRVTHYTGYQVEVSAEISGTIVMARIKYLNGVVSTRSTLKPIDQQLHPLNLGTIASFPTLARALDHLYLQPSSAKYDHRFDESNAKEYLPRHPVD